MENIMRKVMTVLGALALLVGVSSVSAEAAAIKVGVLECRVESGWGAIIGSSKEAKCTFTKSNGKKVHYDGTISKLGIDIGYTSDKTVAWVVMSLEGRSADLSGTYIGAGVEATAIVGLGANALLGGFNDNLALQPISVQGQTGLNVAAAVQTLRLE